MSFLEFLLVYKSSDILVDCEGHYYFEVKIFFAVHIRYFIAEFSFT